MWSCAETRDSSCGMVLVTDLVLEPAGSGAGQADVDEEGAARAERGAGQYFERRVAQQLLQRLAFLESFPDGREQQQFVQNVGMFAGLGAQAESVVHHHQG